MVRGEGPQPHLRELSLRRPLGPRSTAQEEGATSSVLTGSGAPGLTPSSMSMMERRLAVRGESGTLYRPWVLFLERHLRLVPLTEGPVNFQRAPMCGFLREAFEDV
jgi:hypothetical protein